MEIWDKYLYQNHNQEIINKEKDTPRSTELPPSRKKEEGTPLRYAQGHLIRKRHIQENG